MYYICTIVTSFMYDSMERRLKAIFDSFITSLNSENLDIK